MALFIFLLVVAVAIIYLLNSRSSTNIHFPQSASGNVVGKSDSRYVTFYKNDKGEQFSSFNFGFEDSVSMVPHCIVVDVETSGLRKFRNKDPMNLSNWPRIVQISWKMFDEEGKIIEDITEYFKQPRPIPADAVAIHGITDEICKEKGVDPKVVLTHFAESCSKVKFLVGHNIDFDHGVIEANMRRFKVTDDFEMPCKCTMKSSTELLKLHSNFNGKMYKSPNLAELVNFLFYGPGMTAELSSHNAEFDVCYTARCYFELRDRGVID